MADRLKIYACSGLEDSAKTTVSGYQYWSNGSDPMDNTQAVNSLIAKINLCRSELLNLAGLTKKDKIDLLNEIVFYNVSLYFTQEYESDANMLHKAGLAICEVFDNNKAYNKNLTVNNYAAYVDSLISQVVNIMNSNVHITTTKKFDTWWKGNITDLNKIGLTADIRMSVRNSIAKRKDGIGEAKDGWQNDANIGEYLTKASEYFIYTYFTDEQLRGLPYVYAFKKKRQEYVYDYCKGFFVGVYGTEEDMQNVIRAGIIGYFKHTPEEVCEKIYSGSPLVKSVGAAGAATAAVALTGAEIVAIISACLTFIATVVVAVIDIVKQSMIGEQQSINKDAIDSSTPNPEDSAGFNWDDLLNGGKKSWLTIALVALGALLLFRKD